MALKILLVEDDISLQKSITYILQKEGFSVIPVGSGEEALKSAKIEKPDMILLDLVLPGMDGFDVCTKLRNNICTRNCFIIILSGRKNVNDITKGLSQFADDYITKPFEPSILIARIHAVFRRGARFDERDKNNILKFGNLTINPDCREIFVNKKKIMLTKTEFDILLLLAGKPNVVFSRLKILDYVREDNFEITDRIVDFQISGLRKKISDRGKIIETVRGIGYKLVKDPLRK